MTQPKQSPTSLRIPEAIRLKVEAWAAERGIARNAAYVELLELALRAVEAKPPAQVHEALKTWKQPQPEPIRPKSENNIPTSRKVYQAYSKGAAKPAPVVNRLKGQWKAP